MIKKMKNGAKSLADFSFKAKCRSTYEPAYKANILLYHCIFGDFKAFDN